MIRQNYIFRGEVQGVGFRYTAQYLAQSLGLTGWVKNNWDDSVEMEVQGDEKAIEKMISGLYSGRHIYINDVKKTLLQVDEEERGFYIRY